MIKVSNTAIVPYNGEKHWEKYVEMGKEYAHWLNGEVKKHYGVPLFQNIDPDSFMEERAKIWSSIKPPDGVILILTVDGKVGGMGRIDRYKDGIAEAHNIWTSPMYRGKGYATRLMLELEKKAKEFGYITIRLDTARFNVPAQRLYSKLGYEEIERYRQTIFQNEILRKYYEEKVYMEKKL